ncbi:hypothetical protein [Levilactobacillus lettrarii]|uniref:hypothetical protein n=1 Tax=Levilactobacillus lettrarii TaxID=3242689 RepID=UPI0037579291
MILFILQAIEGCCCLGPLMVFLFGFLTIETTIPVISVDLGYTLFNVSGVCFIG